MNIELRLLEILANTVMEKVLTDDNYWELRAEELKARADAIGDFSACLEASLAQGVDDG